MEVPATLLHMRGVTKSFPGVKALSGVDLTLAAHEVLAVLGENGAGKSTLMRVLGGAHVCDAGGIFIEGSEQVFRSPQDARNAGVAVIYQEFNLVPGLNAVENIFLGREETKVGLLQPRLERKQAEALFQRLGVEMDLTVPCRSLTTAQQQLVEIAKALASEAKIIVMDEPSAALTQHEVERLFVIIRELKSRGVGIIYVSHRLDEVFTIADRVTILRDGAVVANQPIADISRQQIIAWMVGRELKDEFPSRNTEPGEVRLAVRNFTREPRVRGVSFDLRRGEILALAGLVGAGRTEVARLIFGADALDAGTLSLDGKPLVLKSPSQAIAAGIGLLTEDRKLQGLVLQHSVRENFALPNLDRLSNQGFVRRGEEKREFASYVDLLRIKIPHQEQRARNLSGGNQQKVVLAKWLARHCEILIFDEPTRGIDAGAKYEIYLLMNELVAQGKAILMISSDLPEVLGMADRVIVMHEGQITGEITDVKTTTQAQIMQLAFA